MTSNETILAKKPGITMGGKNSSCDTIYYLLSCYVECCSPFLLSIKEQQHVKCEVEEGSSSQINPLHLECHGRRRIRRHKFIWGCHFFT